MPPTIYLNKNDDSSTLRWIHDIIYAMTLRERAEEIFEWGMKYRESNFPDGNNSAWDNHSRGAAEVAEKIAEKCGMDADRAYTSGLLHDIGRSKGPHTGLNHIIDGYEILKSQDMPEEIARICMTHSFNPKRTIDTFELADKEKELKIKEYVKSVDYDDYDRLIQLADYMSGAHGVSTIERRFCSVLRRHGFYGIEPREVLNGIYELKEYFDMKSGGDVYELFHEKIATTPFQGLPGGGNVISASSIKKGENR